MNDSTEIILSCDVHVSFPETVTEILTPDNLGCSTTSASRLTTVSRPLASAETAYIVVSLQHKQMFCIQFTSGIYELLAIFAHYFEDGKALKFLILCSH